MKSIDTESAKVELSLVRWKASVAVSVLSLSVVACGGDTNSGSGGQSGSGGNGGAGAMSTSDGGASTTSATNGSGGTSGGNAGSSGSAGSSGTAGSGGEGKQEVPLLEQADTLTYECEVSRAMTPLDIRWADFDLIPTESEGYLARVEADPLSVTESRVVGSPLAMNGMLGSDAVVHSEATRLLLGVSIAPNGDGYSVAWSLESAAESRDLMVARLDASGGIVGTPAVIATTERGVQQQPSIVETSGGLAVTWVSGSSNDNELWFALVQPDGTLDGTPKLLAEAPNITPGAFRRFEDGYALTYSTFASIDIGFEPHLMLLNSAGDPVVETIDLEGSTGFSFSASNGPTFMVRDNDLLVAWPVTEGDFLSEAATTIRVARYASDGTLASPIFQLQAPVTDREAIHPAWIDYGDDVGLLWAEGSIIYVCAGCVPNNEVMFVVLDGQSLRPRSAVVSLANMVTEGGLLEPVAVRHGNDILIAASIQYHIYAEGASGTVTCSK